VTHLHAQNVVTGPNCTVACRIVTYMCLSCNVEILIRCDLHDEHQHHIVPTGNLSEPKNMQWQNV